MKSCLMDPPIYCDESIFACSQKRKGDKLFNGAYCYGVHILFIARLPRNTLKSCAIIPIIISFLP